MYKLKFIIISFINFFFLISLTEIKGQSNAILETRLDSVYKDVSIEIASLNKELSSIDEIIRKLIEKN